MCLEPVLPEGADLFAGEGAEDGDGVAADSRKEMASVAESHRSTAFDCKILHRPTWAFESHFVASMEFILDSKSTTRKGLST